MKKIKRPKLRLEDIGKLNLRVTSEFRSRNISSEVAKRSHHLPRKLSDVVREANEQMLPDNERYPQDDDDG